MTAGFLRRRSPDPARAHGAWVYLFTSIAAGVLTVRGRGLVPAVCVGLAFLGVFVLASALAVRPRPWRLRFASGVALAVLASGAGIVAGADPTFLAYASIALFPVGASVWCAERQGWRSPAALAFAVAALAVAAPAAACAGGTHPGLGLLLLALLAPFLAWRTWRTRRALRSGGWDREKLRRLGLREAALAVAWTAGAVLVVHLAAR